MSYQPEKAGKGILIAGWIFSILGGLIGLAIAAHITFGKVKNEDGTKVQKYDDASIKIGKIMLVVAFIVFMISQIYRATT